MYGGFSPLPAIALVEHLSRFISGVRMPRLKFFDFNREAGDSVAIFLGLFVLYVFLAWVVCGGERWWIIDYVDNTNVFYGDDAYRFFLARSAWLNPDLYTYNFALPGFLLLDGMVVTLAGGDLFLSRSIHALLGALAVTAVWRSGRLLGIDRVTAAVAITVMGMMPRYALTSISFYGEAWLTFLLCIVMFLYLKKYYLQVALFSSLLPLIRPEGMFFWIPLWLCMAWQRRWRECLVMFLPGLTYFIYLNIALPSLSDYGYWRIELRKILNKLVLNKSSWDWLDTYSLLLVIPAFFGPVYRPLRMLWPFLVGGAVWFGWLLLLILGKFSDYEDRYTFVLIPIMILSWAGSLMWLRQKLELNAIPARLVSGCVVLCGVVIVCSHFSNMYMIKGSLRYAGLGTTLSNVIHGRWEKLFMYDSMDKVETWTHAAATIEDLLANDSGIDKLVIFDHVFYYFLNPEAIPRHVTVGYATNGYRVFHILFDGQVFAQHAGGKMYSYLEFSEPRFSSGERRALYVDMMPLVGYPYTWKFAGSEMYLFAYTDSLSPRKSLDNAPMIDLELMKKAYERWW